MLFLLLVLLLKRKKTWFTNLIRINTTESLSTTAPYKRLIDGPVKEKKFGGVACQKSKSADRVLHSCGPMKGPGVP